MRSKKIFLPLLLVVATFATLVISPVAYAALPNKGTWAAYHLINYDGKTFQYLDKDDKSGGAIFYPVDEIPSDKRPECLDSSGNKIYPASMELLVPNNGEPGTSASARKWSRNDANICKIQEKKTVTLEKSERRNKLFVRNTDTDEITTWNSRGSNVFKKVPRSQFTEGWASKPGWEVWRQGDSGVCQDTIVLNPSGKWALLPMADYPDGATHNSQWGWEVQSGSRFYASLFVDDSTGKDKESAYYKDCYMASHKIADNRDGALGYQLGEEATERTFTEAKFRHKDTCGNDANNMEDGSVHRIEQNEFDDEIEGWDGHNTDDSTEDKIEKANGNLINSLIYVKDCVSEGGDHAIIYFVRMDPYKLDQNADSDSKPGIQYRFDSMFRDNWSLEQIGSGIKHEASATDAGLYNIVNGVAELTQAEIDATQKAADLNEHPPEGDEDGSGEDEKTSCAVDGIGWIVCPVMSFMAKMNDKAFGFLENLLTVRPALITDNGTKGAWGTFRDIANVAFVIAFLVIVYSQLTSVGISNYGIKKLLPKIIIAAILVNLSYFICALMVDLSNVVGSSIYGLLANVVEVESGPTGAGGGGPWETIVTVILAAAVGLLLFFIIFTSPFVLIALGIVLLILIARQAFVILLLVVSPLAFVAYLLPNTEDWFKKWWKAFTATLMVYPIVGAIFGASTLASNILMNVANGDDGDDKTLLQIVALTVLAVPLFAVPGVLKSSMAAAGTIGAKIQGLADRAQGRATRDVGKRSSEIAKNLGNRASTSMLNGNGRFARSASFLTGVRRRTKRQDAYKQNQSLRDAAQENFLNQGIASATNAAGQVDTSQLSKTARRRVEAGAAASTAKATNQLINNAGVQGSLAAHGQLYQKVAASDVATHHEQEYHKNQGEKEFYNNVQADPGRQAHYNELVKSREDRQAAETRANNQSKQDGEVRRAIRENKVAKGEEKIVDNEIEIEHQSSDEGMKQGQKVRETEGKLEVIKGEQDVHFEKSVEGQNIAVQKDDVQQRKVIAQAANEQVAIEQNKGVRVDAAAATATLDAAKAGEKALLEELKTGAGVLANPELATAAAVLQAADTQAKLAANRTKAATDQAEQAFVESTEGRKSSLATQQAADNLAGAKATEEAIESELRSGGRDADGNLIQVDGLSEAEVEQFATDLSEADRTKRAQTQRGNAAKRVGDVKYAEAVKDSINKDGTAKSDGLAEIAGGIEGQAGVSQAAAVAQQTIIESHKKGVAAESTLLSNTDEGVILTGKDNEGNVVSSVSLDSPDILDQPDEKISAMGSVIAKRQHMTSHIKLWERMGELQRELKDDAEKIEKMPENTPDEVKAKAEAMEKHKIKKSKLGNLQQQVMSDKSKKPFGIGDADQGAATVGEYGANIYETTRERILTHLSADTLANMDPDDLALIYEMHKAGQLTQAHEDKILEAYQQWEDSPQLKDKLRDKARNVLDRIVDPSITGEYLGQKEPKPTYGITADSFK